MNGLTERIRRLAAIPGVSGREEAVRAAILEEIKGRCARCEVDALGNLIVFKKGRERPANKLLFAAHMDEVGFVITFIEEDGLLRFSTVGGIDTRVIVGKPVEVGDKRLGGVVGSKAHHQRSEKEREDVAEPDALYIDIGAHSRDEAQQYVSIGDRAIFCADFMELGEHRIAGRAFDDRAGCALLVALIERELPYDCYFAFTVQEETGCVGARAAGFTVAPDIVAVVETTTAADIAGVPPDKAVCRLGEGPVLSFIDKGTVYDRALYDRAFAVAQKRGIPCQPKTLVAGGNDSSSFQVAGAGCRALAVSLPCRYLHSPSNLLDTRDVQAAAQLLHALAGELAGG